MFSRIISAPFLVLAIGFLYLTWDVNPSYAFYIIPCVIILAVIYIMSPQIEWWWAKRNPPELDDQARLLIHKHSGFYKRLSAEDKTYFRRRLVYFLMNKEFMPQAFELVPEDIKIMIAAAAVQVTFGQVDFVLEPFDKIVVYPEAFPSPQYPRHRHSSETFAEDGVILVSARHVAHGFMDPQKYYPSAIHEYAHVFMIKYPALEYPELPANSWEAITQISGFSKEKLLEWIGLPQVDPYLVMLTCFFSYPEKFESTLPDLYQSLVSLFRLDAIHPVSSAPLVS
ncbi:MAG: zinc-dependent peptidase [Saprospiraceae bacterium]|nr:zinc-dependent peptidase [Saprospiraceae bacterium]